MRMKREEVIAVDIEGRYVAEGRIVKVIPHERNNGTSIVTFSFPKKFYKKVSYFKRKK